MLQLSAWQTVAGKRAYYERAGGRCADLLRNSARGETNMGVGGQAVITDVSFDRAAGFDLAHPASFADFQ
jgi:hypothetical protein